MPSGWRFWGQVHDQYDALPVGKELLTHEGEGAPLPEDVRHQIIAWLERTFASMH